ncbi:MAG TPA: hypothetical protein VFV19_02505 [Candidatus Polarisedimenticolaceae bacterium]|nr:hypothetical protein [Candidatus Polarisedimenticolaceae bacterium]
MNTLRRSMALALLSAGAVFGQARAEVSAELDAFGGYVRTVIEANASVRNPRIWTVSHLRMGRVALNTRGDRSGDLYPAVAEDTAHQRWPWVVWSHFNGLDFDLVWSRWEGRGWSQVKAVVPGIDRSDAVDPAIAISAGGRPYVVWLSRGAGAATVQMSMFLVSVWSPPMVISDPGDDAMSPQIAWLSDGRIQVDYDTIGAHVTKTITFASTSTVTDDLNPGTSAGVTSNVTQPPIGGK